jgi:geranylgeranyl diphosphate synthase type I
MAFQLQDDLLDVWGASDRTGKPAREDLRARKHSFPVVLAFARAPRGVQAELRRLYAPAAPLSDEALAALVAIMDELQVRAEGERLVLERLDASLSALDQAQPTQAGRELIRSLVQTLMQRQA